MSQPNNPNNPPDSGAGASRASASMPFQFGGGRNQQITDAQRADLENRGTSVINQMTSIHEARLRGDPFSWHDFRIAAREFQEIENVLGRPLPNPFNNGRSPGRLRHPITFDQDVRALRETIYHCEEHTEASPFTSNPIQPLDLPRARPSPGLSSGGPNITPSPAPHQGSSSHASNSVSRGSLSRLRADVPPFVPGAPSPSVTPLLPSAFPPFSNAYANPNPAYSATPVAPTHIEPTIPGAYLGVGNPMHVPNRAYSQFPSPVVPTSPQTNLRGNSFQRNQPVESNSRGKQPVGSSFQRNQPARSNLRGNRPVTSNLQWNQSVGSSSQGNQPRRNIFQRNQPMSSSFHGNQPRRSTFQGNQPVESSLQGNQPAGSSFHGNQSVGNPFQGNQPAGNFFSGNQPVANPFQGNQPAGNPFSGNQSAGNSFSGNQSAGNPFPGNQPERNPFPRNQPAGNPFPGNQPERNPFPRNQPAVNPFPGNQSAGNPFSGNQPAGNPFPGNQPAENPFQRNQPVRHPFPGDQPVGNPFQENQPTESNLQENQPEEGNSQGNQTGEEISQESPPEERREYSISPEEDLWELMNRMETPNGTLSAELNRLAREREQDRNSDDSSSPLWDSPPNSLITLSSPRPGLDIDDGRPIPQTLENMTVNLECKICFTQRCSVVLLPCGHLIMCKWCARLIVPLQPGSAHRPAEKSECPLCRMEIVVRWDLFLGE